MAPCPDSFHPSGLSRVEFNVRLKLRRNVFPGVDGVHRTFQHAVNRLARKGHRKSRKKEGMNLTTDEETFVKELVRPRLFPCALEATCLLPKVEVDRLPCPAVRRSDAASGI